MQAFSIEVPDWTTEIAATHAGPFATPEPRMALAIALARASAEHGGGPFGAAVFDTAGWRLLGIGVNLVVPACCSTAHAEILALSAAQRAVGAHNLAAGGRVCELVTSTEPCAMCLGAIPWSGVQSLLCGASDRDARDAGFDEGDKPADWPGRLARRGVRVTCDVLRREAAAVLRDYAKRGGVIYNGG